MLSVLFGTPVGIMSIITVVGTMFVVSFWLYYIFKKHEE
jgi:hypothetical protein